VQEVVVHLLDQRLVGVVVLLVLALLVVVKKRATGSMVELPTGDRLVKTANVFNLLFLLVISPLSAILLITRTAASVDPTHVVSANASLATAIQVAGLLTYVGGYALMAWALAVLGRQYQPGGASPHPGDRIVVTGPYRFVRHPMYAAALVGALGLALLMESWAFLCAFLVYLVLILVLVRREEESLRRAFGGHYADYAARVSRLVPFVY
jgi:protein-S-isoprenylcysteine O-methyltransferase Ste14